MKKKLLAMALCVGMLLSAGIGPVSAADGNSFADVSSGDWFYEGVRYVYENNLMSGISQTSFDPNAATNRAMIVRILYRMNGDPAVTAGNTFSDVPEGQWYTEAVTWAAGLGVVSGYEDGRYQPERLITLEQLAVILYNYASTEGYDVSGRDELTKFSGEISGYAETAMAWAGAVDLLAADGDAPLDPQGTVTRAQLAETLRRLHTSPLLGCIVTINYNYAGASGEPEPTLVRVRAGESMQEPARPERAGHGFMGWFTAAYGGQRVNFNAPITEDMTIYARWIYFDYGANLVEGRPLNSVAVTFDYNYSGVSSTVKYVTPGQTVAQPANPTRAGYVFDGWFTSRVGVERFDFTKPINKTTTIYAHWK